MTRLFILTRNPRAENKIDGISINSSGEYVYWADQKEEVEWMAIFCKQIWDDTKNFEKFKRLFVDCLAHEFCHKIIREEKIIPEPNMFQEHWGIHQMHIHSGDIDELRKLDIRFLNLCKRFEKMKKEQR